MAGRPNIHSSLWLSLPTRARCVKSLRKIVVQPVPSVELPLVTLYGRVVVMFGGAPLTPPKLPLPDSWEWDGGNWSTVATAAAPAIDPGQRAQMAYDPVTRTVILRTTSTSGGVNTTHTWSFDGRQWGRSALGALA